MTVYKNIISTAGDKIAPQSEAGAGPEPGSHSACDLEQIFAREFASRYHTRLVGGASEPLYAPAPPQGNLQQHEREQQHCIYYRENYFASALHEVAHWCIAGLARRRQIDYGYWYAPDGRGAQQQRAFEMAEQKPQALEWIFAIICGARFSISVDNLNQATAATEAGQFAHAVRQAALGYCANGLPGRASQFACALNRHYRGEQAPHFIAFVYDVLRAEQIPANTLPATTLKENTLAGQTHA